MKKTDPAMLYLENAEKVSEHLLSLISTRCTEN